ncbi:hypothetical protein UlMin_026347 [Ulmus minor]
MFRADFDPNELYEISDQLHEAYQQQVQQEVHQQQAQYPVQHYPVQHQVQYPVQYHFQQVPHQVQLEVHRQFPAPNADELPRDHFDEDIFVSNEFRMYAFKIKRCPRLRPHDWTECPYAHAGEKAMRRDLRIHSYTAVACPAYRDGGRCYKGELCEFAHGVFEYWLHPARYRTRPCNAGQFCRRKVCFFAHSQEEIRYPPPKLKRHYSYRARTALLRAGGDSPQINMINAASRGGGPGLIARPTARPSSSSLELPQPAEEAELGILDYEEDEYRWFMDSVRGLNISEDSGSSARVGTVENWIAGLELPESEMPHLGWVTDLLN